MSQISNSNQNSGDLLRILLALEQKVMRDLKVASLGKVKQIDGKKVMVEKFPLFDNEPSVLNECWNNVKDLAVNDIVVILYMDRNFIQNLNQLINNQRLTNMSGKSELHSNKYGIVISKINLNDEEEG